MKKILLVMISLFLFVSCWDKEEETVIEETGRIVDEYVDTLETSVWDAKAVRELINKWQKGLEEELDIIK